jgi:Zn-dependent metalloprotease
MVTLNQEELKQIEQGQAVDQIFAKKQEERKLKEEEILKKIEENASKKQLKTEKELKEHYKKLEVITLRNGKKINGTVIAQTENLMVIHTPQGVVRVNKNDVESQEFK